ncbi:MAG: leucine-rich repeat domain-containing protein [Anaerolineae bacterium]
MTLAGWRSRRNCTRNNRLAALPESIGERQPAAAVFAGQSTDYPAGCSLGKLARLTELDLRNNRLTELPGYHWRTDRSAYLDLRGNKLDGIAAEPRDLPNLEKLDLRWESAGRPLGWIERLQARGCSVYPGCRARQWRT